MLEGLGNFGCSSLSALFGAGLQRWEETQADIMRTSMNIMNHADKMTILFYDVRLSRFPAFGVSQ